MNIELKKKIEEVTDQKTPEIIRINPAYTPSYHCGFEKGAEWGYKEAIKVAKEWLKEYTLTNHTANGNICTVFFETKKELIANFETDMNKFLEGKK